MAPLTHKLLVATLAVATLVGCGKTTVGAANAPRVQAAKASQIVGIPTTYQAGVPIPGSDGTASVRQVNWPRISKTAKGASSDPINVVISGAERHVRHVFAQAGWVEADTINPITAIKTIKSSIFGSKYDTAPMSDLFLFNRKQDLALQKNNVSNRSRDHLRVWKTPQLDRLGRPVWVVAATEDVAIKLAPGELLPTHQISPFIDNERQLVVDDFLKSGHVAMRYQLQSLEPGFRGVNGGGDEFQTDGKAEVLELVPMKY